MKKKTITLFFFLLSLSLYGQAQQLYVHWTKFFGGYYDDVLRDAVPTSDGGIVFTGLSSSIDGDIPFSAPDTLNGLRHNLMVGKIDSNKQLVWMKIYRGQQKDYGFKVIELSDGGYAVLGQTESSDGDVSWNRGSFDMWLLRLDANGDMIWQRTFGSSYSDQAISIAETSDSCFLLLGYSNGFDHDVPFHYGTSQFDCDFLLLKVSSSGDLIWSKTIGGYGDEGWTGSVFEANGGYYIAGYSNSRDNDCSDTSWCANINTGYDAYLFFTDTAGNLQWSRSYGGSAWDGIVNAFWDDRDNTIVMAGLTRSNDLMVTQPGLPVAACWLLKVSQAGDIIWQTVTGDSLGDNYFPDVMPVEGGYFVACYIEDNLQNYNIGNEDVLGISLDTQGNVQASKLIGGIKGDRVFATVPYKQGFAVLGYSLSNHFVEGVNDNTNHNPITQSDAVISYFAQYPLSSGQLLGQSNVKVFPNPAKERVRISLPPDDMDGVLRISDAGGKTKLKQRLRNTGSYDINTATWPQGTYIVEWRGKDRQLSTGKLVIVR